MPIVRLTPPREPRPSALRRLLALLASTRLRVR